MNKELSELSDSYYYYLDNIYFNKVLQLYLIFTLLNTLLKLLVYWVKKERTSVI